MERRRALVIGSLIVAAVALVLLLVVTRNTDSRTARVATADSATTTAATSQLSVAPPPVTSAAPNVVATGNDGPVALAAPSSSVSAAPGESLADAIKDPDPLAARDAIAAAVARKDVSALKTLATVDLSKNGYVAAAAISGTGKLAAVASDADKHAAVKTLERWLKDETARGKTANDAIANTSIVIDALHDSGSSEAIAPLVAALDSGNEPLHLETRIVQTLDAMDARSAAPSIEKFAERLRGTPPPSDDLDKALLKEALEAAEATLAKWK